jgi:hypothetical protein
VPTISVFLAHSVSTNLGLVYQLSRSFASSSTIQEEVCSPGYLSPYTVSFSVYNVKFHTYPELLSHTL